MPLHSLEILAFATRHHYEGLVNKAAPLVLQTRLLDVLEVLPSDWVLPWVRVLLLSSVCIPNRTGHPTGSLRHEMARNTDRKDAPYRQNSPRTRRIPQTRLLFGAWVRGTSPLPYGPDEIAFHPRKREGRGQGGTLHRALVHLRVIA